MRIIVGWWRGRLGRSLSSSCEQTLVENVLGPYTIAESHKLEQFIPSLDTFSKLGLELVDVIATVLARIVYELIGASYMFLFLKSCSDPQTFVVHAAVVFVFEQAVQNALERCRGWID